MRLTLEDVERACDWGFNCGPGALCAVLDMAPDEIRPHLLDFEAKGYTNPTLMASILNGLGVKWHAVKERAQTANGIVPALPSFGLVRIQWGGPWTKPGVPIAARYRHTHWIAHRLVGFASEVFDLSAVGVGGWMSYREWSTELVPWLLKECQPKADGTFWPTHCWEVVADRTPGRRRPCG